MCMWSLSFFLSLSQNIWLYHTHLFLDHSWPRVIETAESETAGGDLQYIEKMDNFLK